MHTHIYKIILCLTHTIWRQRELHDKLKPCAYQCKYLYYLLTHILWKWCQCTTRCQELELSVTWVDAYRNKSYILCQWKWFLTLYIYFKTWCQLLWKASDPVQYSTAEQLWRLFPPNLFFPSKWIDITVSHALWLSHHPLWYTSLPLLSSQVQ